MSKKSKKQKNNDHYIILNLEPQKNENNKKDSLESKIDSLINNILKHKKEIYNLLNNDDVSNDNKKNQVNLRFKEYAILKKIKDINNLKNYNFLYDLLFPSLVKTNLGLVITRDLLSKYYYSFLGLNSKKIDKDIINKTLLNIFFSENFIYKNKNELLKNFELKKEEISLKKKYKTLINNYNSSLENAINKINEIKNFDISFLEDRIFDLNNYIFENSKKIKKEETINNFSYEEYDNLLLYLKLKNNQIINELTDVVINLEENKYSKESIQNNFSKIVDYFVFLNYESKFKAFLNKAFSFSKNNFTKNNFYYNHNYLYKEDYQMKVIAFLLKKITSSLLKNINQKNNKLDYMLNESSLNDKEYFSFNKDSNNFYEKILGFIMEEAIIEENKKTDSSKLEDIEDILKKSQVINVFSKKFYKNNKDYFFILNKNDILRKNIGKYGTVDFDRGLKELTGELRLLFRNYEKNFNNKKSKSSLNKLKKDFLKEAKEKIRYYGPILKISLSNSYSALTEKLKNIVEGRLMPKLNQFGFDLTNFKKYLIIGYDNTEFKKPFNSMLDLINEEKNYGLGKSFYIEENNKKKKKDINYTVISLEHKDYISYLNNKKNSNSKKINDENLPKILAIQYRVKRSSLLEKIIAKISGSDKFKSMKKLDDTNPYLIKDVLGIKLIVNQKELSEISYNLLSSFKKENITNNKGVSNIKDYIKKPKEKEYYDKKRKVIRKELLFRGLKFTLETGLILNDNYEVLPFEVQIIGHEDELQHKKTYLENHLRTKEAIKETGIPYEELYHELAKVILLKK